MLKRLDMLAQPVLMLPRVVKRLVALSVDASLCMLTVWLAFYLRLGEFVSLADRGPMIATAVSLLFALPLFIVFGFYRAIFRYSGWPALMTVFKATAIYGLIYASVFTAIGIQGVPRTVGLIQPVLLLLAVGVSRAFARYWLGGLYQNQLRRESLPGVMIYGAGVAGLQLAAAMANSHEVRLVGFLDDDSRLHGHVLQGLTIYSPDDLPGLVVSLRVGDVLLAIPSMGRKRRNEILENMRHAGVSVRTLPSMTDLAQGRVSITDLRELDIDDLLGRESVSPNFILLSQKVLRKVVLVTGAGGSIGSELCRQILALGPVKLLMVEQSEYALYQIYEELSKKLGASEDATMVQLVPLLGSVCDKERMREIMVTWQPDTVYHTAAYKHVPMVEHNPAQGIMNNVLGTLAAARAASENGVQDFVLISTDKAVRPTNIMGASKRLAEMILQAMAQEGGATTFSMVRFGNVLGSSGSVVPLFRQQIREGGPITLTHEEITRYFMTIPEAAQLVIQAGAMAKGGDVFVLDMGEPVRIKDLAVRMIELSGLTVRDEANPEGDIEICITGLRPGEKLYEELLIGDDPRSTLHPRIMKAHEHFLPMTELIPQLEAMQMAIEVNDVAVIRKLLQELIPGYQPAGDIVDWVYLEQVEEAWQLKDVGSG